MSTSTTPPAEEIIDTTADLDSSSSDNEGPSQPASSSSNNKKKKKKKGKSKAAKALNALRGKGNDEVPDEVVKTVLETVKAQGGVAEGEATAENVREALRELKIMDVVKGKAGIGGHNKKDMGSHKFWGTQPVPQLGEETPEEDGYIEPSVPPEQVRQEPYPLPKDYEWSMVDVEDPVQRKEVYDLLSANYVEDDQAAFRFRYTAEFLHWALMPPGYHKEWHIGVRVSTNKKLVAFISGVPMTLFVRKNIFRASEINYLCVHKKLRSKRLTPVLIKEVTRQCHLKGVFQAIYTAGIVIPTPVSICRYFHRSLNIPKLVEVHFTAVPRSMTLARMSRMHKVPDSTTIAGLREMEEKDVVQVVELYTRYMRRFEMFVVMTVEEARHHFMSGRGRGEVGSGGPGRREGQVTWNYVVEDPTTHKITDFFTFYTLPSSIINHPRHSVLEAAYLYYYATETAFQPNAEEDGTLKKRLMALVGDALVIANNAKFDVFNALTLMDNVPFLQELEFGAGDGYLNFYLYNWRTAPLAGMNATDGVPAGKGVGVVML